MDTIDPTSCPAAIREPSVRADADDSDTSRRTEAAETIILVTTSMNRLSFEEQRAQEADTLTLFRVYIP